MQKLFQADPSTIIALGDLSSPTVLLAIFGIAVSVILITVGVKAGIFTG